MSTYTDQELIQLYRTLGKNTNGVVIKDAKNAEKKLLNVWESGHSKTKINSRNDTQINKIIEERDKIYELMKQRNIFPQTYENKIEEEGGLYPDSDDPQFILKLLQKQEFYENKQPSVAESIENKVDPCKSSKGFELSATQRFIGQFLSPRTPYMSALLFHGVGVGKTCSAITVAENFLEVYPRKQVIIVAPRNIQPNFTREIFDEAKLRIGDDDEPNTYNGCTGNTYLKLTNTEFTRDKKSIMNAINQMKTKRYQLVGYLAFYNYLKEMLETTITKGLDERRQKEEEDKKLRQLFSNRLIIIDEAHNVRDLTETDDDSIDAPGGKAEMSESQAGKKLTPYLRKLLRAAQGTKLLLLTATPMYNTYKEIIPLLNLLLINDNKESVSEADFFAADGTFLAGQEKKFGETIQPYVSFMRGENPLTFPIRLEPKGLPRVTQWPRKDPLGNVIADETLKGSEVKLRDQIVRLPFVSAEHTGKGLEDYRALVVKLIGASGLLLGSTDGLVQAGNFLFPSAISMSPESRIREQGFKNVFQELKEPRQFKISAGIDPSWLHEDNVQQYSPKCNTILKRLRKTSGVTFIFSRFVFSGALSIALALEANGYENAGRSTGYLKDGVLAPGGKQCAYCDKKQDTHANADHEFKQAKYVMLTGRDDLTPNNKGSIELATRVQNKDGGDVKVVIGSQVASEGIDLKFIREVIVFDSWWHLNKLEQVIGRGIRFCSHAALPAEKRNCTVSLLLTTFPMTQDQETIDMFQYREGFKKAFQIGMITRIMKRYAIDCNLNRDAVIMTGLKDVDIIDSQGNEYKHSINDVGYSSVCDWIQTCDYTCATPIDFKSKDFKIDTSTYDEYAARWRSFQVKQRLRILFERQPFYHSDDLLHMFDDIPTEAAYAILREVVDNRLFRLTVKNETGYILYKNGFFMFQPEKLLDTGIPLALRAAFFPVKQDSYEEFEEAPIIVAAPRLAPSHPAAAAVAAASSSTAERKEEEKEEEVGQIGAVETVVELWTLFSSLIDSIQNGDLPPASSDKKMLPEPIETALRNRYSGNKRAFDKAYNSISMVTRIYTDIQGNEEWRDILGIAVAKYLWDEILTNDEQYALYRKKKDNPSGILKAVWKDHLLTFDGKILFRRVNPSTGTIEYKCDGVSCNPAIIAGAEAANEATDPIRQLRANTTTMGNPYGTINYKRGDFVFKTNTPVPPSSNPAVREKQERGSECSIVPNMIPHYNLLEQLGRIAQEAIGTNLGFTLAELQDAQAPRGVKNSTRACALTDMALRFFDELHIGGKRWFLRSLPTFTTEHPGKLQKEKEKKGLPKQI